MRDVAARQSNTVGPLIRNPTMDSLTPEQLTQKKCLPCEGGVAPYTLPQAQAQIAQLDSWRLTENNQRIRQDWVVSDFMAAMDFFQAVAQVAEDDGHHPDLHVWGYRNVWIELWTHAIGGLSENDFILAAKIDTLPIQIKA